MWFWMPKVLNARWVLLKLVLEDSILVSTRLEWYSYISCMGDLAGMAKYNRSCDHAMRTA